MIRILKIFMWGLFFTASLIAVAFPMGGRVKNFPMKTYPGINIPDGEFLHYISYNGGDKSGDIYFVVRKINNGKGKFLYRIYLDMVPLGEKPPENFTNWPVTYLIDPERAVTLESDAHYDKKMMDNPVTAAFGIGNLISFQYRLNRDKGYVEYLSKNVKGSVTNESRYLIKVNPDFPGGKDMEFMFYSIRMLDVRSGGISYTIMPEFMKEPMAGFYKIDSKLTVKAGAGTFSVNKIIAIGGDPFFAKLLEPILKKFAYYVEDSDRRLVVKVNTFAGDIVLEEISNVNLKKR